MPDTKENSDPVCAQSKIWVRTDLKSRIRIRTRSPWITTLGSIGIAYLAHDREGNIVVSNKLLDFLRGSRLLPTKLVTGEP